MGNLDFVRSRADLTRPSPNRMRPHLDAYFEEILIVYCPYDIVQILIRVLFWYRYIFFTFCVLIEIIDHISCVGG